MTQLEELINEKFTLVGSGDYPKTLEHDSLVYDKKKDIFFWNSRGIAGDVYVWLTKVEGIPHKSAKEQIRKYKNTGLTAYTEVVNTKGESIVVYPKLAKLLWRNGKNKLDYWTKRGITRASVDRFLLGYYEGWYTIPLFFDGTLMNIQKRRDLPEKAIKYWYRGVGPTFFNADILRVASTVILTESPTDAILLNQHGYPAISHSGGAEFWSSNWNKYFSDTKEIYVVYDNDSPGISGARKVAKNLGEYRCKVLNFREYPDKYDLGDWLMNENPNDFGEYLINNAKFIFESSDVK